MRALYAMSMLAACTSPDPGHEPKSAGHHPLSPTREVFERATTRHGLTLPDAPIGGHAGDGRWAAPPVIERLPPPSTETVLGRLLGTVEDARFDPERGEALEERLDELDPALVAAYGVGALTLDELIGPESICEAPRILSEFRQGGVDWEAALDIGQYLALVGEPQALARSLTDACEDDLATHGGVPEDAPGCSDDEIHDLIGPPEEPTDCRVCLAESLGDWDACVDADACEPLVQATAWVLEDGEPRYYDQMLVELLACAPDHTVYTYALGDVTSYVVPPAFDHAAWAYLCLPYWDEESDAAVLACTPGETGPEVGDTLVEGAIGYVDYIREQGAGGIKPWHGLSFYADVIDFTEGPDIRWTWGYTPGLGAISSPTLAPDTDGDGASDLGDENFGYAGIGIGLNPYALRPGGEDPLDPGQTFARDYIGMVQMKGATTRNGVPIGVVNHNRCAAWAGPLADGSWRCADVTPPDAGWLNDGQNASTTSLYTQDYPFTLVTLGSTGRMDEAIPGGFVPHLAGSETLADPDWDDCAMANRFVTDTIPVEALPDRYGGDAPFDGQTYRFGKPGDPGLRVVLATNQLRGYCPADATGTRWRTYDSERE